MSSTSETDSLSVQFAQTGGPLTARIYQLIVTRTHLEYGTSARLLTTDRVGCIDGAWRRSLTDEEWAPLPHLNPGGQGLELLGELVAIYRGQDDREPSCCTSPDPRFPLLVEIAIHPNPHRAPRNPSHTP